MSVYTVFAKVAYIFLFIVCHLHVTLPLSLSPTHNKVVTTVPTAPRLHSKQTVCNIEEVESLKQEGLSPHQHLNHF